MSFLTTAPEFVASAAMDLAGIRSVIGAANEAVAATTTAVLPAGADEISAAVAQLFGAHGQAYQALSAQAAQFHEQFVQIMRSAAGAYAGAEAANVAPLQALAAAGTPLQQLEQMQVEFNTNLVANELAFNKALLTNEVALERQFFGTDSALNGVLNRAFNTGNLFVGTGQQAVNLFFGAPVPANFTSSLLLGSGAQAFNGGQIGGLVGAFDQSLMVPGNLLGLAGVNVPGLPADPFRQLEQMQIGFNTSLVNNQMAFNQALVTNEIALERQFFGTDSALNGVLNRSFNAGNLLLGTGQQAVDLFFGAPVPTNFTSNLLLGSGAQTFNGGEIGGLVGAFDQGLMAGVDAVGLVTEPFTA
ncbi:hypothetical protein A5634_00260 [Mycobacterium asiaticum]|uniref:PE domain-containing protein n=1 Tax=Mycobacterium asiaticum TaxID=1790 RepID=A0A1A3NYW2_MYCAS|nr:PE family protein [Mycobacterium asiaticum]OBK26600.1 hypothetical protein A5634_00260 [Mycobacterium asiaticum]